MVNLFVMHYWTSVWWIHHRPSGWLATQVTRNTEKDSRYHTWQRSVTRTFHLFFDLRMNKRLGKHSRRRWFESPLRSLWRHCNDLATGSILNEYNIITLKLIGPLCVRTGEFYIQPISIDIGSAAIFLETCSTILNDVILSAGIIYETIESQRNSPEDVFRFKSQHCTCWWPSTAGC